MICDTDNELSVFLNKWQRILKLGHWQVKVRLATEKEMPYDVQGAINYVEPRLSANIKILRKEDYDKDCAFPQDHEQTLVHELLHLWFCPYMVLYDENPEKYVAQEQTINILSTLLVKQERDRFNVEMKLAQMTGWRDEAQQAFDSTSDAWSDLNQEKQALQREYDQLKAEHRKLLDEHDSLKLMHLQADEGLGKPDIITWHQPSHAIAPTD